MVKDDDVYFSNYVRRFFPEALRSSPLFVGHGVIYEEDCKFHVQRLCNRYAANYLNNAIVFHDKKNNLNHLRDTYNRVKNQSSGTYIYIRGWNTIECSNADDSLRAKIYKSINDL